ncbi:hypothetical protein [Paenibacillus kribbensis]|uniref:hypothetical protein n=1 Tax=Paenibacillus kribbensis TaxID=172713 RepID=UPI00083840A4|nr:hypothetical protein [Paenibacillus kribbensis]
MILIDLSNQTAVVTGGKLGSNPKYLKFELIDDKTGPRVIQDMGLESCELNKPRSSLPVATAQFFQTDRIV